MPKNERKMYCGCDLVERESTSVMLDLASGFGRYQSKSHQVERGRQQLSLWTHSLQELGWCWGGYTDHWDTWYNSGSTLGLFFLSFLFFSFFLFLVSLFALPLNSLISHAPSISPPPPTLSSRSNKCIDNSSYLYFHSLIEEVTMTRLSFKKETLHLAQQFL